MENRFKIAASGLLLAGLAACGLSPSGDVYAKPYDVVYAELAATPIPLQVIRAMPNATPHVVRNPGTIQWRFAGSNGDVATFVATLTKVDEGHTRVTLTVIAGKAIDPAASPLLASPFMVNITRLGMTEQVAAELEDRPFNKLAYGSRLSTYMNTHPGDMIGFGNSLKDMMNDVATQANGYPSPGARNYGVPSYRARHPDEPLMPGEPGYNPVPDTLDPRLTHYEATHPETDLSAYR